MGNCCLGLELDLFNLDKQKQLFFRLLQLSTFSVFLGRAWQHIYWDAPYRTLFWDEKIWGWVVHNFTSQDWNDYILNTEVEDSIIMFIKATGLVYVFCAISALLIGKVPRIAKGILWLGVLNLLFLAFLYCKEKFFSVGQFFEYTLQFGSPVFLLLWVQKEKLDTRYFILLLKLAIAFTFTCHGLYAIGFYPRPVVFLEMTMNILNVSEESAIQFLNLAGLLDFIISFGIFLPWRWSKYCLGYAVIWGFLTTIARVWANFQLEWLDYVLLQWLHESIMRAPHFLIPASVLVLESGLKKC